MTYDDLRNAQYEHNDPRNREDTNVTCECCGVQYDKDDVYALDEDMVCEGCYWKIIESEE